jgi:UDP-glucose 4-epimerase
VNKVVALTGATGFVGRVTLDHLLASGWTVRALARADQPKRKGVTWINGALDRPDALAKLCDGADAIMHIAAVVNAPDAAAFEAGNVIGTANMLAAAKEAGISRFLHISSLSAREPQLSHYGASKAKAERLVATSLIDWTIIRPPGVYGPGDVDVYEMFRMAQRACCRLRARDRGSMLRIWRAYWSQRCLPMKMPLRAFLRQMMANKAAGAMQVLPARSVGHWANG